MTGQVASEANLAAANDAALVTALRAGNEEAFLALVERYHSGLVRLAQHYVRSRAVAEEVAQDTWLAVLERIDHFEERSSLKTWLFHILTNRAKSRGEREGRTVTFTDLVAAEVGREERAVDPERFLPSGHRYAGHWSAAPRPWDVPEEGLLCAEVREQIRTAMSRLNATQRQVMFMRDVEGWSATEVCEVLGISDVNQRVLLHRARSRVRASLDGYLEVTARSQHSAATSGS